MTFTKLVNYLVIGIFVILFAKIFIGLIAGTIAFGVAVLKITLPFIIVGAVVVWINNKCK